MHPGYKVAHQLLLADAGTGERIVPTDNSRHFVAGLARSHSGRLRQFLSRRVRNVADVPDIVQEVFLRMLRVEDPAAIRSPEAYLFTVALHVAQQHSMKNSALQGSAEVVELFAQLQAATDGDPALQVEAEQRLDLALLALDRLSPMVRATFILHRQHGLSLKEIARELNVSFPMAKKYLAKALFQFHKHLGAAQGDCQ
jgi:RNA polymerase sigma-70 factor (ECF subfamily)